MNIIEGFLVLSLTTDDAVGPAGAMPGFSLTTSRAGHPGALLGTLCAIWFMALARRRSEPREA